MTKPLDVEHDLYTEKWGKAKVLVPACFPKDYGFCLVVGHPGVDPIVRIQSRCAYGEVFGSLHCDCSQQLELSIRHMQENGGGLVFYLEQEGRGAGSTAKAQAYAAHQSNGTDTFDFFGHEFGESDFRSYEPVAKVLLTMLCGRIRLITNNPMKIAALEKEGVQCERIKIETRVSSYATDYINSKRLRGHDI